MHVDERDLLVQESEGDGATFYTGERLTKFGIFPQQLERAVQLARVHGLEIDGVRGHVGDGYLWSQLSVFEETAPRVTAAARFL